MSLSNLLVTLKILKCIYGYSSTTDVKAVLKHKDSGTIKLLSKDDSFEGQV